MCVVSLELDTWSGLIPISLQLGTVLINYNIISIHMYNLLIINIIALI